MAIHRPQVLTACLRTDPQGDRRQRQSSRSKKGSQGTVQKYPTKRSKSWQGSDFKWMMCDGQGAMRTRCKVCCHKLCGNLEHGQHASILEKYSGWLHSHVRPLFPALLDQISLGNPLQGLPLAAACGWCFSYAKKVKSGYPRATAFRSHEWRNLEIVWLEMGLLRHFMAAISVNIC